MTLKMNNHYKKLRALLAILTDEDALDDLINQALIANKTPASKSKLQGWRIAPDHKNYRHMTSDELLDVLNALVEHYKND